MGTSADLFLRLAGAASAPGHGLLSRSVAGNTVGVAVAEHVARRCALDASRRTRALLDPSGSYDNDANTRKQSLHERCRGSMLPRATGNASGWSHRATGARYLGSAVAGEGDLLGANRLATSGSRSPPPLPDATRATASCTTLVYRSCCGSLASSAAGAVEPHAAHWTVDCPRTRGYSAVCRACAPDPAPGERRNRSQCIPFPYGCVIRSG